MCRATVASQSERDFDAQADHDEHDVHFESADAGASLTYPQQAGTIRKGAFIVIKNRPCKVRLQLKKIIAGYMALLVRSLPLEVWNAPSTDFGHSFSLLLGTRCRQSD